MSDDGVRAAGRPLARVARSGSRVGTHVGLVTGAAPPGLGLRSGR